MDGVRQFHASEIRSRRASVVHGLNVLHSFFLEPATDFVRCDHGDAGALRDLDHVRHMIAMAVGHENKIRRDFAGIDILRERIGRDEGIEEQCLAPRFHGEAGMAVVGEFH